MKVSERYVLALLQQLGIFRSPHTWSKDLIGSLRSKDTYLGTGICPSLDGYGEVYDRLNSIWTEPGIS